jgi:hypothetical protein
VKTVHLRRLDLGAMAFTEDMPLRGGVYVTDSNLGKI